MMTKWRGQGDGVCVRYTPKLALPADIEGEPQLPGPRYPAATELWNYASCGHSATPASNNCSMQHR